MKKLLISVVALVLISSTSYATFEQGMDAVNNPNTEFVCTNLRVLKMGNKPLTVDNGVMVIAEGFGLKQMKIRVSKYLETGYLYKETVRRTMEFEFLWENETFPGAWLQEEDIGINKYQGDGFRLTVYTGEGMVQVLDHVLTFNGFIEYTDTDGKSKERRIECAVPNAYDRKMKYGDVFGGGLHGDGSIDKAQAELLYGKN